MKKYFKNHNFMRAAVACALVLVLCLSVSIFAYAATIDEDKTGSVSVTMTYEGEAVTGGTLTLYRVGDINTAVDHYYFTLTSDFEGSGVSLENPSDAAVAQTLADYAAAAEIGGDCVEIDDDGSVVFSNLEQGLYLIVQDTACDGYETVSPFLVSVPELEDGEFVYDVDATPKMSLTQIPSETEATTSEDSSNGGSSSGGSSSGGAAEKLAQTGQLKWPVPVLAVTGCFLLIVGYAIRGTKQNEERPAHIAG